MGKWVLAKGKHESSQTLSERETLILDMASVNTLFTQEGVVTLWQISQKQQEVASSSN